MLYKMIKTQKNNQYNSNSVFKKKETQFSFIEIPSKFKCLLNDEQITEEKLKKIKITEKEYN